jgi:cell division protein FtsL
MNTKAFIAAVATSLILAIAISGTVVYYNGVVDEKNSKINSLNNQAAGLNDEVSNLTVQLANIADQSASFGALQANLTASNLAVANLTSQNIDLNHQIQNLSGQAADLRNQVANLNGQVENLSSQLTILTTANIVTALGIREIPTTYQVAVGASPQYLSAPYNHLYIQGSVTNSGAGTAFNAGLQVIAYDANGALEINMTVPFDSGAQFGTDASTRSYANQNDAALHLASLAGAATAQVNVNIFHEGIISNWIVSPVWTNFP